MMVEAKRVVFEREHNGRAWLAFHVAHLPHQKRPIPLADLQITRRKETDPPKGWQSTAEIETVMRRWRFAMVTHNPSTRRDNRAGIALGSSPQGRV